MDLVPPFRVASYVSLDADPAPFDRAAPENSRGNKFTLPGARPFASNTIAVKASMADANKRTRFRRRNSPIFDHSDSRPMRSSVICSRRNFSLTQR